MTKPLLLTILFSSVCMLFSLKAQFPVTFEDDPTSYNFVGFEGAESVIEANPDQTGDNTSATAMRTTKNVDALFYAGTAVDLDAAIDFSSSTTIQFNSWSPKADIPVRFALENQSTGNQIFVDVNTVTANTWETLSADFAGLLDPAIEYNKVVIFYEFIVDLAGDGTTYYFDNIDLTPPPPVIVGLPLTFELDAAEYGYIGFEGAESVIETNPDQSGDNTSATAMRTTKNVDALFYAGTAIDLDTPIDFSASTILEFNSWSPKADIPVRFAIENQATGNQIFVDVNTVNSSAWETLTVDFAGILDPAIEYNKVVIFYEFIVDLAGDGTTYYFDNIALALPPSVDIALPLTFELDAAEYGYIGFEGAESVIETNPDQSGENTSATAMRTTKNVDALFYAGTAVDLDIPIDFSTSTIIEFDSWSPKADIPVRVALENQTTGNQIFVDVNTVNSSAWETLSVDFAGILDPAIEYNKVVIFYEFIVDLAGDGTTYYFDNIALALPPSVDIALPLTFELDAAEYGYIGFEGAESVIEINPDQSGENTSATAMRTTKNVDALFYAGTAVDLDIPIDFSTSTIIEFDSWSPKADIPVRVALENQTTGNQIVVDVNTVTASTWETLSVDFAGLLDPAIQYNKVVIFFEFIVDLPGDGTTYYFDNIDVATDTGIEELLAENITVNAFPNPSNSSWTIQLTDLEIETVELYDMTGRLIQYEVVNNTQTEIPAQQLIEGMYIAKVKTSKGVRNLRLIKQ